MKLSIHSTITTAAFIINAVSAQSLTQIESVEYDSANNRYLISNSTNIIAQSASDGSLSVFGEGASAQYGMEIMDEILYAISTPGIKGYDLETGEEVLNVTIDDVTFPNGMASNGSNLIWITDTFGPSITQINVQDKQNPQVEKIVENMNDSPNGIFYDKEGERLVYVNWGNNAEIKAVDLEDYSVKTILTTDRGNCDGITRDRTGNWYISCWLPQSGVYKISPDFSGTLVPIEGAFDSPADITYNPEEDIVAVPNTGDNKILLIQLDNPLSAKPSLFSGVSPNVHAGKINIQDKIMIFVYKDQFRRPDLYNIQGQIQIKKGY